MFHRFDFALLGYSLLSFWMGVLLFHTTVVVPVASRLLKRETLGEFALSVQNSFHRWGLILTALSTLSLAVGEAYASTLLSAVVFASLLFSEYLRRRVRRLLKRYREEKSEDVKRAIFETYRFVAYATYTQAVAGLGAILIGWLRL